MSKAPGPKLFTCQRHTGELRISRVFCGESWRRAQEATDTVERTRLRPCRDCAVGKRNAQGEPQPRPARRQAMWSIR